MNKLDSFKEFVKNKPFLKQKVDAKETTWQSLYETYDLFGESADIFKESSERKTQNQSSAPTNNILKILEGINLDKINENLESMKKIIGVLGEFTKKEEPKTSRRSTPKTPKGYDD